MKNFMVCIFFLPLIFSCNNDDQFEIGREYYPVSVGDFKVYDVQKITKYSMNDSVIENYQVKEVVLDTFTLNNELKYRIERFKRISSSDNFPVTPDSVWYTHVDESRIIRSENNIRYIKLVFPLDDGKSWNGNAENNLGAKTYLMKKLKSGFLTFPEALKVIQSASSNEVAVDTSYEVYSKNIGMVFKYLHKYEYLQLNGHLTDTIDHGIYYYERLNSYGPQ